MPSRFISITSHIVIWPSFFRFLMHHHISIFCSFLSLLYVFIPFEECICYLYCCNINIMPQLFQCVFATDLILSITNVVEFHARWQICKPSTTANTHTQTLITIRRKRDMTIGKFNEFDFFLTILWFQVEWEWREEREREHSNGFITETFSFY